MQQKSVDGHKKRNVWEDLVEVESKLSNGSQHHPPAMPGGLNV